MGREQPVCHDCFNHFRRRSGVFSRPKCRSQNLEEGSCVRVCVYARQLAGLNSLKRDLLTQSRFRRPLQFRSAFQAPTPIPEVIYQAERYLVRPVSFVQFSKSDTHKRIGQDKALSAASGKRGPTKVSSPGGAELALSNSMVIRDEPVGTALSSPGNGIDCSLKCTKVNTLEISKKSFDSYDSTIVHQHS